MVIVKSQDEFEIIAGMITSVQTLCNDVLSPRAARLTIKKIAKRVRYEGIAFLTKALPRLGKELDRALSSDVPFDASKAGFKTLPGSKLPRFLGELFGQIFTSDGRVLEHPNAASVGHIRTILYLFYKYELPYSKSQEHEIISQFERTEREVMPYDAYFGTLAFHAYGLQDHSHCDEGYNSRYNFHHEAIVEGVTRDYFETISKLGTVSGPKLIDDKRRSIVTSARKLLQQLFTGFDPLDIVPRHGPGSVSTKEKLFGKYAFSAIPRKLSSRYPIDAYFYASLGHVCDDFANNYEHSYHHKITDHKPSAKVVLVPKDSRGPRLISMEPLSNQWIQQGQMRSIVRLVESHPLTRWNINFTNQHPNQCGALLGSIRGEYSTLDLKEASDRVTVGLVRLLFPEGIIPYLESSRSDETTLPDGRRLRLCKFAPMGSALCFPILALTIWSLLTAGTDDTDTRESILVYGDDVIVPTAYAEHAMNILELFGLKLNRSKSCTMGFFRESCGVDAFKGINVTPVRIRTVWSSRPSPNVYESYIAYANALFHRRYYAAYWVIADKLLKAYKHIPEKRDKILSYPALMLVPSSQQTHKTRWNKRLQKREFRVRVSEPKKIRKRINGWHMLLRYFTSTGNNDAGPLQLFQEPVKDLVLSPSHASDNDALRAGGLLLDLGLVNAFDVRAYTDRNANKLVWRWR